MDTFDFAGKLRLAGELLEQKEFEVSIREHCQLLEAGLRHILTHLLTRLEGYEAVNRINTAVARVGKGKLNLPRLGFGQLAGVFIEADVLPILRRNFDSNFKRTKKIDWNEVVEWRNRVTHQTVEGRMGKSRHEPTSYDDALFISLWTKAFLYDCELVSKNIAVAPQSRQDSSISQSMDCSQCENGLEEVWIFCPFCGTQINPECRACNNKLKTEWKICPFCEEPIAEHDSAESTRMKWEYMNICKGAWMDGVVNAEERQYLDSLRLELGIDVDEATLIEGKVAPPASIEFMHKVEDFLVDGEISQAERDYLDQLADRLGIDAMHYQSIEHSMREAEKSRDLV